MYREGRPVRKTVPLNLIVDSRRVLVVGGGQVGRRKVSSLLACGAKVELVCPDAVDELLQLAKSGQIVWTRREWRAGDSAGHLLVFACTDDKHVNRAVLNDSRLAHVPCCCSDMNWADGDFTTPATAHVGDVSVAVSTSGQCCKEARDVKRAIVEFLESRESPEFEIIGTSDVLLSAEKRAVFHLSAEKRVELGRMLSCVRGINGFFILNTCNRVEIVFNGDCKEEVVSAVSRLAGFDVLKPNERFRFRGFEAFRHLAIVAAGLESAQLGEFHVVSQFKDALDEAERNGWSNAAIRRLGDDTLRVSKAIRHETENLLQVEEIDQVALDWLFGHAELTSESEVAVIGTGMLGKALVDALRKTGCRISWIYHRNRPDSEVGVQMFSLDEIEKVLRSADAVISAVSSQEPIVKEEMAISKKAILIDLGMPRNFHSSFGAVDLDELKKWHHADTGTLAEVIRRADEVISREYLK